MVVLAEQGILAEQPVSGEAAGTLILLWEPKDSEQLGEEPCCHLG